MTLISTVTHKSERGLFENIGGEAQFKEESCPRANEVRFKSHTLKVLVS